MYSKALNSTLMIICCKDILYKKITTVTIMKGSECFWRIQLKNKPTKEYGS